MKNIPINITEAAASQIKQLLEDEEENIKLRVFITGGGCSGFQYGFTFEKNLSEQDLIIEKDDVELIIDPMSLQYLINATIDFKSDLMGSQFTISNPNASTTCGCGSSFSV